MEEQSLTQFTKSSFVFLLPAVLSAQTGSSQQETFFENRIRPVLAENCYACHDSSRMGGLSLQTRDDMLKGGNSGAAIVPGDPEKSLLVHALRQDRTLKMPQGGKLTEAQVGDFAKWIQDGAVWPASAPASQQPKAKAGSQYVITPQQRQFWSIQPLRASAPPEVQDKNWPKNDIDRFILAKLEKDGLKPAPDADRRTLLRRVTYDLTGLTPSYEEVKAFENDQSPDAYEKIVDRLLASPRYGERWGRLWLDVVRYSEDNYRTPGFKTAPDRIERFPFAYKYRDWVIDAINKDLPYDVFVKAQLAADLMEKKDRDQYIAALGMNGLGVWHWDANPAVVERADEWNGKVDSTTRAFLGLTVACARCHNHKYDPIPQQDYYRLASVFASSDSRSYPLVPQNVADDYDKKKAALEQKEATLEKFLTDASELHARTILARTEDYMLAAWRLGANPKLTIPQAAAERGLDTLALQRWVRFLRKPPVNYGDLKPWQSMVARGGTEEEAKQLAAEFHERVDQVVELRQKVADENAALKAKFGGGKGGRMDLLPNGSKRRLEMRDYTLKGLDREPGYLWKDMFEEDLPDYPLGVDSYVNGTPPPGLLVFQGADLEARLGPEWVAHVQFLRDDIEAFKKAMPQQYPFAYGLAEKPEPEIVKVHLRGSPYSLGEDAPAGFLTLLSDSESQTFKHGSGRLELAEDIVKQPIAQRVIVNRIWRWNMGTGLVNTPSNFGLMGERPSNPELLEYLTAKFVADGMSWRKLQKEIVMSRTYRLASSLPAADAKIDEQKDQDNRLYWRANRRRVESEGLWDLLLAASGKLDLSKQDGPSEHFTDDMFHRAVFGNVSRMTPDDFQQVWDFPVATLSSEGRYTTNVPPQRLFFLNSTVIYKRAGDMAERVAAQAGTLDDQIRKAYELVYQREPAKVEIETIKRIVQQPVDGISEADAAKTSPLKSVCWAILSSNEFLYID